MDPLAPSYPWNSTYAFAEGDVIRSVDLDGLEKKIVIKWISVFGTGTVNALVDAPAVVAYTVQSIDPFFVSSTNMAETWVETRYIENYFLISSELVAEEPIYSHENPIRPSAAYNYTDPISIREKNNDDSRYRKLNPKSNYNKDISDRDSYAPEAKMKNFEDATTAISASTYFFGFWVSKNRKSMNSKPRKYQEQITKKKFNGDFIDEYHLNGIDFDGFENGILFDAKGDYSIRTQIWGKFGMEAKISNDFLKEGRAQLSAAEGLPIQWHFTHKQEADFTRNLFKDNNIDIEVFHTPAKFEYPRKF